MIALALSKNAEKLAVNELEEDKIEILYLAFLLSECGNGEEDPSTSLLRETL